MDIQIVTELINGVGFPITVCIGLFWVMRSTMIEFKNSLNAFKDALNSNTNTLNLLNAKIERLEK